MRLSFSKKGDSRGRHLVLTCDAEEASTVLPVLYEVTEGRRLIRDYSGDRRQRVRFHFGLKYLQTLSLALPQAEFSDGVRITQSKLELERLRSLPVPEIEIPGLRGELRDFQKVALGVVLDNPRYFLNDDLGLGKTVIALSTLAVLDAYPALVVCPNSAKHQAWNADAEKFFPHLDVQVVDGTKAQRIAQINTPADIYVINYEALRLHPELASFTYEYLIADEYHRIKNPTAQMTKAFHKLSAKRYLLMSGTPLLNKVEDLWSPLHRCWPKTFSSSYHFEQDHCIKTGGMYPKVIGYHPPAMRTLKRFLNDHSLRRRREHVSDQLPDITYTTQLVDLSPEQWQRYSEVRDDAFIRMDDGTIKNVNGVLPIITRLKQACFSPELWGGTPKSAKVEMLKEVMEQVASSGHKALVFTQWSKAARIIQRELEEYNPAYVDGTIPARRRKAEADRFNHDADCHLYIGTIGANKEAINLGAASYVIFTDEDWVPLNNDQAIGRSAAGGLRGLEFGVEHVHVIDLFADDTVEVRLKALLASKRATFNSVIERDGGTVRKGEKLTLRELRSIL